METEKDKQPEDLATGGKEDSLENPATTVEGSAPASGGAADGDDKVKVTTEVVKDKKSPLAKFNLYLLAFIVIILLAVIIVGYAYVMGRKSPSAVDIASQTLSQKGFEQLANSESTVGSNDRILNVQSSAVFAGRVLARQDLEVAGNLSLGGTLALTNITASGTAQIGQAQVSKNLTVAGTTSLQGAVTVAGSLQVSGGASFSGTVTAPQVSTSNFQLAGDLTLVRHINAGGATPGRTNGGGLGSGGTSSVSGSDTAGSITINTGSSPAAGCFITVNFATRYNSTPKVQITPVGSVAGGLDYYINRNAAGFSVCVSTPAPAGSSFGFDYFVVN